MVYPHGAIFAQLEDAFDCARLDSSTGPDFASRVEDADTEAVLARFAKGKQQ